ncbi:aldose 1-epimerase family protein [Adhaeribacter terreus]|uniref:Aldose 1-epimerase family protein n=1 Tax=Adhaeribacter terreus TaxID=529703 RepID=A0ABW0E7A8_9BACT
MTHTLRNSEFEVKIKAKGAEVCSFRRLSDNTEYIWQGDTKIWPRHAPVLFPIVGRLPEHKYFLNGKSYHLPQHGFARDMIFTPVEANDNTLTMELHWSDITMTHYPFHFRLLVSYALDDNTLQVDYRVMNLDEQEMPFSIGAHPGFNCPLKPENKFEDYYLEFDEDQNLDRHLLNDGLLIGETETVLKNDKKLALTRELFKQDAIVLKENKAQTMRLKSDADDRQVEIKFRGFPYLGIWSPPKPEANLLCLEPWHGIASNTGEPTEITEKEGIILLPSGHKFECSYQITVS